jgi:hypothetical protein
LLKLRKRRRLDEARTAGNTDARPAGRNYSTTRTLKHERNVSGVRECSRETAAVQYSDRTPGRTM